MLTGNGAARRITLDGAMNIEDHLSKEAANIATRLGEYAQARLLAYRPLVGIDYQCPGCWAENATESKLAPIPNPENQRLDIFRCRTCNKNFLPPI
jgi:hypothetical protein